MDDRKLTALDPLTTPADGDWQYIVDISDTTDGAEGTSKRVALSNARGYPRTAGEIAAVITPVNLQYEPGNVLRYGDNVSQGVTDMTAAVQSAVTLGAAYLPDGIYLITATVTVGANKTRISGESPSAVLKRGPLFYEPLIKCDGFDDFEASGFSIDGNLAGNPLDNGTYDPSGGGAAIVLLDQGEIVCIDSERANVHHIDVLNSITSPVMFHNCLDSHMYRCSSNGNAREGFHIISGRECSITNCSLYGASPLPWSCFATSGLAADSWEHRHRVTDNYAFDSQAAFITINTSSTLVADNIIGKKLAIASTGPGIRLGHATAGADANNATVHGNYIFDIDDVGAGGIGRWISIENADGCEVVDNRIHNCAAGIGASNQQNIDIVVNDNRVYDCDTLGIDLFYIKDSECCSNTVRGTPTGFRFSSQNVLVKENYVYDASTSGFTVNAASGLNSLNVFDGNVTDSLTTTKWTVASPNNNTWLRQEYGTEVTNWIAVTGATPDTSAGNHFSLTQTGATNVTGFLQDVQDAIYTIYFGDGNSTLKQSSGFRLLGGVDVNPAAGQYMTFRNNGTLLYEVHRSFTMPLSEVVTATNVITADESGTTFYLNSDTEFVSTLPAPAIGLKFTFIVTAAPSGAAYTLVTASSANIMSGTVSDIVGETVYGTAQDLITFADGVSVIGDRVDVESDGTNWYYRAVSGADGGITTGQT